ncbi:MAG: hypothetical protein PWQ75_1114 [Methanolobus sp.]|jgi:hypothetical protein|uniref:hypothetical protein n=1 Tax=Methanolobus sp. TaxID=1874737 RepID=UPI0024AA2055|nr:hypothetical protein [Methanolobus sp.]MDI3486613.1 hypothetical protein [Methanolobus sp.]MDK2831362.1 hypothetical protein [Methanolobus sp.]
MPCKNCGGRLLIGKRADDTALWCPKCEGVKVLSKSETKKLSINKIRENAEFKSRLLSKYSKQSVIGALCATLETSCINKDNFRHICSTSYAIKDVLKKKKDNFGSYVTMIDGDLQDLIRIYDFEFHETYVNNSLINDDYIIGTIIPLEKLPEYAMNKKHLNAKNEEVVLRFTEDWSFNRLIATRYGLYSKNDFEKQDGPKQWAQKATYNSDLSRANYLFQFVAGTSKLSKDLKSNSNLIEVLEQLSSDFVHLFTPNFIGELTGTIYTITKTEILDSISKVTSDPNMIYDKIIKLEFPLIIELKDTCFVLPNTCDFYLFLLYSQKYENELNHQKIEWGSNFEELVFKSLELFGYNMINPKDNKPLLNFIVEDPDDQINNKKRSFELDIAGFKDNSSILIECKHWDIGADFFKRKAIEKRERELVNELKKFQHKINLINNDDKFDFLTKDKKLETYFVTLHPERIEQYGDIKVVPFNQFYPSDFESESNTTNEIEIKDGVILTQRKYKNGKVALIIDYTRMILNPYGINHFRIDPDSELKSYIYIGDGIVNNYNQKELIIDTPNFMRVIVDLVDEDFAYLKSKKIKKKSKVRYQISTTDPLLSIYHLRLIRKL